MRILTNVSKAELDYLTCVSKDFDRDKMSFVKAF